jgi:ribonuclease Z
MARKSRLILWAVVCAVAVAALVVSQRELIVLALAKRQIATVTRNVDPAASLADGLHVGLCGAGSPFADEKRGAPCTIVIAGRHLFVFDAGGSAARGIGRMQINIGKVEALFLTHYHSDHIDGLGELMLQRWGVGTATSPLPIYGPEGLETVLAGFQQAYSQDRDWRVAHHGNKIIPPAGFGGVAHPFVLPADTGRVVVLAEPDLEIVAFAVNHEPISHAVGYRIRYKDRTVVISGDTRKSAAVAREAKDVDLLLHEALSPPLLSLLEQGFRDADRLALATVMKDVVSYHTTPEEAAEIAQGAGVKALVYHHIVPPLPNSGLNSLFVGRSAQIFGGTLKVGEDGDWFSLPAGSTAINVGHRP